MVTLLLVSHSPKIVEGVRDLALEMAGETRIIPIGGTNDGRLGADFDRIFMAMSEAAAIGEVLVLSDLGSAKLTAEMAREALDSVAQQRVYLCNAALVEGALAAAVSIAGNTDVAGVVTELQDYLLDK